MSSPVSDSLDADGESRHDRQVRVPEVGAAGQRRLAAARVLVVGVGGIGSAAALGLARAGVGALRLVDGDRVRGTDLGRQVLYGEADLGRVKVQAAAESLARHAPGVGIETIAVPLGPANVAAAFAGVDLVIDGTDALAPRRLVNRAAFTARSPVVFGGAAGTAGLVLPVVPPSGPCYACALPETDSTAAFRAGTCDVIGVITPLVLLVGAMQATAGVAILLGRGEPGRLTIFDATGGARTVRVAADPRCPVCGSG